MCIICVELEKSLITPLEARRNLAEMAFDIDLDHFLEVEEKIEEKLEKNQFYSLLTGEKTAELCSKCGYDPCDCLWGPDD
jgi:signal-transduction protein with cAMP-binding, CBS, and nucleotidyltransferase domain